MLRYILQNAEINTHFRHEKLLKNRVKVINYTSSTGRTFFVDMLKDKECTNEKS
jgi:hypothetical protein